MKRNGRKIYELIAIQCLFALILLFTIQSSILGQTEESIPVNIPDQAKEQVIRRILTWYFKPRNQKKIIYLAEQEIQESWLPKLKGIDFQILSAAEVEEKDGVYFFTKLEQNSKNKYEIGFAYGDPSCNFIGDSWYFRINQNQVKLWHDGSGFGNGCGRGHSF